MTRQNDTAYGIKRLESKNARAAIIQKISADFNLMPIVAEAYYKQISSYFEQHADVQLTSGQICYEAVAAEEPAGKHIALAKKVSCRLTLNDIQEDFEVLSTYGLAGLRRHRILRLTQEAYDQEALLSHEDMAVLLTTSPATVKRYIRALKQSGPVSGFHRMMLPFALPPARIFPSGAYASAETPYPLAVKRAISSSVTVS